MLTYDKRLCMKRIAEQEKRKKKNKRRRSRKRALINVSTMLDPLGYSLARQDDEKAGTFFSYKQHKYMTSGRKSIMKLVYRSPRAGCSTNLCQVFPTAWIEKKEKKGAFFLCKAQCIISIDKSAGEEKDDVHVGHWRRQQQMHGPYKHRQSK